MRTALLALRATGAAAALLALSAVSAPPAASAAPANGEENRGSVWATPSTATPGSQIELRVNGCRGSRGVARSAVFVAEADLSGRDGDGSPLFGEAMISSGAQPGWHTIRVTCDGHDGKATGSIQVVRHDSHQPTHHPSPVWPVHAGGGGMAAELAAKEDKQLAAPTRHEGPADGPGMPHSVIGAVLAAAATLAVAGRALAVRRRRSGD
ncbi:hypothetical protein [Streptomyces sp. NPDC089919]|uniref:hypothetical protein n=1 Tax=Streptomyces sp. NPDC089919 TaxID=3155188 RepID=UPI003447F272